MEKPFHKQIMEKTIFQIILTIQPLTAFLRDLKSKGVLEAEKVRVVINKELKVRSLTAKQLSVECHSITIHQCHL